MLEKGSSPGRVVLPSRTAIIPALSHQETEDDLWERLYHSLNFEMDFNAFLNCFFKIATNSSR